MGSNVSFYNLFVVFVSFVLFVVRKLKLTPMRLRGNDAPGFALSESLRLGNWFLSASRLTFARVRMEERVGISEG